MENHYVQALNSHKEVSGDSRLFLVAAPAICQMTYNVSVYTDVTWDGSNLLATSTSIDSSTGCNAHSGYETTARLIAPDGSQTSATSSGMVANTIAPVAGRTSGTWYGTGLVRFFCGCYYVSPGGSGAAVPITFAITYTQSKSLMSDGNGYCAQNHACINGAPKCPVASIKECFGVCPCDLFHECLTACIAGVCLPFPICTSAGGQGNCTL